MINKSLNKYQTGGSAPTEDQKNDMIEFISWIKSNVDGFKDKSENEIANAIVDMSKSDEGKKSVKNLYDKFIKSKKASKNKPAFNKLGGKIQSFICKHAKGGSVDCGCSGGVVKAEDGRVFPSTVRYLNENGVDSDPNEIIRNGMRDNKERTITSMENLTPWNTNINRWDGGYWADKNQQPLPETWGNVNTWVFGINPETGRYDLLPDKGIPSVKTDYRGHALYQNGGEVVMTQTSERPDVALTRQQAMALAAQNYGYNDDQFTVAPENAYKALYNQGFRGKELRQKALTLAAGINNSVKSFNLTYTPSAENLPPQPIKEKTIVVERSGDKPQASSPVEEIVSASQSQPQGQKSADKKASKVTIYSISDPVSRVNPNDYLIESSFGLNANPTYSDAFNNWMSRPAYTPVRYSAAQDNASMTATPTDSADTGNSVENTNVDYVQEYLKTHYPNGSKRNFITRIFQPYVVRENSNVETSPLFIGPLSPRYSNNAIVVGKRGSYKEGGKVEKTQNGTKDPNVTPRDSSEVNYYPVAWPFSKKIADEGMQFINTDGKDVYILPKNNGFVFNGKEKGVGFGTYYSPDINEFQKTKWYYPFTFKGEPARYLSPVDEEKVSDVKRLLEYARNKKK